MQNIKRMLAILISAAVVIFCCGCMDGMNAGALTPKLPEDLKQDDQGIPVIRLYNTDNDTIEEIDIESYIMGVVAGEMRNDWPLEALKAQAILARTFTMKFLSTKDSKYEGADISTDIHEAQAYDALAVNDRIRKAVEETRGVVMVSGGDYPHAWFHAHSGGKTELPSKALEYKEDPSYLTVSDSMESEDAPETVKRWTAEFTHEEVLIALGSDAKMVESFEIGEKGESGRAVTFIINGKTVSAPSFRIKIDASKLKSTLVDSIRITDDKIIITGRGFGHGVGMSQWGAYALASEGKTYDDIISQYYSDIRLVRLWK